MRGEKSPRLKSRRVYWWCMLRAETFLHPALKPTPAHSHWAIQHALVSLPIWFLIVFSTMASLTKDFFSPTECCVCELWIVMCVQDKWERWTRDKELPLCCCLLIKGLFNPFIIITCSNYCMHLILGPERETMKNANGRCAHLAHYVLMCTYMQPSCPILTCTFVNSHRFPRFSLTHFKENAPPRSF